MKALAPLLMFANASVFLFGAVQHAGVALGPFHEPRILPAAIVETICGLLLAGAQRRCCARQGQKKAWR
ncbi:MAG: hypothetical protein WB781_26560 [Candidatus Sulfotelmatobacter sp.]